MQPPKKIKCLIIDDEPPAREILKKHITGVEALELAGECANAVEALSFLQRNTVELLFLDIQMPHIMGTSFIRTLKNPPKVIFTTAFREFAVEGFELNAVDYLVKPIGFERFLQAVNKVLEINLPFSGNMNQFTEPVTESSNPFLYFRVDRKMVKVYLQDILLIESQKDYIKVITANRTIVTKQPISSLEEILPNTNFLRIHRSYIVAIDKINSFYADSVEVGEIEIPIGRSFKNEVNKILNSK
ncbi:MAG: LytTR family DNA-binding domain-containing protein [Chitinophagaceae bacterium]